MTTLKAGQQYLITSIKFTKAGYETITAGNQRIDQFKVPSTTNEIHDWLNDYDHSCADKTALAIYIRSRLFYYHEMTFNFQLIKDQTVDNDIIISIPTFADIADHEYTEYTTATVDINIPTAYVATLSTDEVEIAHNDVEQALFENMLNRLPIDFNVLTLTDKVLELMADYMNEKDAPAPDSISESAYDLIAEYTGQIDNDKPIIVKDFDLADNVQDAVFRLSSALVKDIGKYL